MGFSAFDILSPEKKRELVTYTGNGANHKDEHKPPIETLFVAMETIAPQKVDWLWVNRIPIGRLTLLDGDPGAGKSFLSLAVATAVSRGAALPGVTNSCSPSGVLLMSIEDGFADLFALV